MAGVLSTKIKMKFSFITTLCYYLTLFSIGHTVICQRVEIVVDGNGLLPTQSLNEREVIILVKLSVSNGTHQLGVIDSVDLNCSLEFGDTDNGYTLANLVGVTGNNTVNGDLFNNVTFWLTRAGRENPLQCEANIVVTGAGTQSFRVVSDPVGLKALQAPRLYFYSQVITIPNQIKVWRDSVKLRFSSAITSAVRVTCGITTPMNSSILEFIPKNLTGLRKTEVTSVEYIINEKVHLLLRVTCAAESLSSTQYLLNTSQTDSAEFRLGKAVAFITPSAGVFSTISFQALLSLDQQVSNTIEFECSVSSHDSLKIAQQQKSMLQECTTTNRTRPPTTSAPTTTTTPLPTTEANGTAANMTTPNSNMTTSNSNMTTTTGSFSTTDNGVTTTTTPAATTTTLTTTTTVTTSTTTAAPNTTTSANVTSTTAAPPVNATAPPPLSKWKLASENNTLVVEKNTHQLQFTVERRSAPNSSIEEYILLSCCPQVDNSDQIFEGAFASSLLRFDYEPPAPVDDIQSGTSTIQNPAYVELAPCPCDLTTPLCDVDCSCDTDCSVKELALFNQMIGGAFGGEDLPPADHMCTRNDRVGAPDWAPLLCTVSANNSYLGLFYPIGSVITSEGEFPFVSSQSYRRSDVEDILPEVPSVGYKKGTFIKRKNEGYLSLPQPAYSGICDDTIPVTYLNDIDSQCTFTMEEDVCLSTMSRLNVANYLQKTSDTSNFSPSQISITLADNVLVETRFDCPDQLLNYFSTQTASATATQSAGYLLADAKEIEYCAWDNGQTFPPSPSLVGGVCKNALVDVTYDIEYNNTFISKITAVYIMADIPITPESSTYNVSWYELVDSNLTLTNQTTANQSSANQTMPASVTLNTIPAGVPDSTLYILNSTEVNDTTPPGNTVLTTKYRATYRPVDVTDPVKHSGRPGYNMDTAINLAQLNTSIFTLTKLPQPTLPMTGVDGLCELSGTTLVKFPYSQVSQCQLEISPQDLEDCSRLRHLVYQQLELLFPVIKADTYISRFGVANYRMFAHWILMLRDVKDYGLNQTTSTSSATSVISNTTSTSTVSTTAAITTSTTATTSANTTDTPTPGVTPPTKVKVQGECSAVPTVASLRVMYTLSGKSAGVPIYQIVGAKVGVSESPWQYPCLGLSCQTSSAGRFSLTFTTEFIEVPAVEPPSVMSYYKKKAEECERCVPPWTRESFLYPLFGDIPSSLKAENLAMCLVLAALFIFIGCASRPWWHK